ncbi:septal ring lytic transglycosylase RlpA family protein [Candidatus Pelagibacter sp.]|nr:septal ring lytic transglycosylase RlpA family protein [Candidatus Pelagibacter sp.]
MKYNLLIILSVTFLLFGCDQLTNNQPKIKDFSFENKYKNSGFSLVYNDQLKIKKIDQRSLTIFHQTLKKKSYVKITNPINGKSLIAEVKSNTVKFSPFFNSIITERIANDLELNLKEPYVSIILISKNSTFVAEKSKTFDEEKKVAEKAPIDGIKISNLNKNEKNKKKSKKNQKFSYSIKIADFYYKKSAQNMIKKIKEEVRLTNFKIIQISKTNYRLILGPFSDIKSLKDNFEKINSLYFENLEILKNV